MAHFLTLEYFCAVRRFHRLRPVAIDLISMSFWSLTSSFSTSNISIWNCDAILGAITSISVFTKGKTCVLQQVLLLLCPEFCKNLKPHWSFAQHTENCQTHHLLFPAVVVQTPVAAVEFMKFRSWCCCSCDDTSFSFCLNPFRSV